MKLQQAGTVPESQGKRLEFWGTGEGHFLPYTWAAPPFFYGVHPPRSQIQGCFSWVNSAGLIPRMLWDTTPQQRCWDPRGCRLVLGYSETFAKCPQTQHRYKGNSTSTWWTHLAPPWLRIYFTQFTNCQRLFHWLSLTGGHEEKANSGSLGPFADLSLGSVLVETSQGTKWGPTQAHPGTAEATTN